MLEIKGKIDKKMSVLDIQNLHKFAYHNDLVEINEPLYVIYHLKGNFISNTKMVSN